MASGQLQRTGERTVRILAPKTNSDDPLILPFSRRLPLPLIQRAIFSREGPLISGEYRSISSTCHHRGVWMCASPQ